MAANFRLAALIALASLSGSVAAQTVGELADIQARTIIERAKANLKKAEDEARGAEASSASSDTPPVVSLIMGRDKQLVATFLYANGAESPPIKAGGTAPGGYYVRSITENRVVLVKGGRSIDLFYSDVRPIAETPTPRAATPTTPVFQGLPPMAPSAPTNPAK